MRDADVIIRAVQIDAISDLCGKQIARSHGPVTRSVVIVCGTVRQLWSSPGRIGIHMLNHLIITIPNGRCGRIRGDAAVSIVYVEPGVLKTAQRGDSYPGAKLSRTAVVRLDLVVELLAVLAGKYDIVAIGVFNLRVIQRDIDQNRKVCVRAYDLILVYGDELAILEIVLLPVFFLDEFAGVYGSRLARNVGRSTLVCRKLHVVLGFYPVQGSGFV